MTRHFVATAWFPHEPVGAVTYCPKIAKSAWEHSIKGAIAQQNSTKDTLSAARERSDM